jgi:hypothetical protein
MKNKLNVTVVNPKTCRKRICCEGCELSYNKEDYLLFFKARKLVYFNMIAEDSKQIKICDCCLVALALMTCAKYDLPYISIIIKGEENTKQINIEYSEDKLFEEELLKVFKQVK